jgi:hypothetical protein
VILVRRAGSLLLGLAVAAATLRLAACSAIDPNPPNPHDDGGGEALIKSSDASDDAIEEP